MSQPHAGPGMPPPAPAVQPPGGGGGRGKTVGIVVGALVVVGAVVGGLFASGVVGGGDDASYKLTAPRTVAGDYTLKGKPKKGKSGEVFTKDGPGGGKRIPGLKADGDLTAQYRAGTKQLQLGGAYGEVDDPKAGVDWLFEQMQKEFAPIGKPTGKPKEYSPSGFDGDSLKCQEFKVDTLSMKICVWGDSSTIGAVSMADMSGGLSVGKAAELAAQVRSDARVKA
ncbi:hypothetical protein GCM10009801_53320 [Streptomyces albiaxialis]|uniref:Lipoprotein n=1 Tax=Streptomyces albiaxialis TaxID=329523 RepID=A0ABN2WCG5_9ACTN